MNQDLIQQDQVLGIQDYQELNDQLSLNVSALLIQEGVFKEEVETLKSEIITIEGKATLKTVTKTRGKFNKLLKNFKEVRMDVTRIIDALKKSVIEYEKKVTENAVEARDELNLKIKAFNEELIRMEQERQKKEQERLQLIAQQKANYDDILRKIKENLTSITFPTWKESIEKLREDIKNINPADFNTIDSVHINLDKDSFNRSVTSVEGHWIIEQAKHDKEQEDRAILEELNKKPFDEPEGEGLFKNPAGLEGDMPVPKDEEKPINPIIFDQINNLTSHATENMTVKLARGAAKEEYETEKNELELYKAAMRSGIESVVFTKEAQEAISAVVDPGLFSVDFNRTTVKAHLSKTEIVPLKGLVITFKTGYILK